MSCHPYFLLQLSHQTPYLCLDGSNTLQYPFRLLPLVQFYRQTVGVAEEHETLARIFVRAYRFVCYLFVIEFADSSIQVVHLKCKMAQSGGFGR